MSERQIYGEHTEQTLDFTVKLTLEATEGIVKVSFVTLLGYFYKKAETAANLYIFRFVEYKICKKFDFELY